MKQEALRHFTEIGWVLGAFGLFLSAYTSILWQTFKTRDRTYYDTMADLPLKGD